MAQESPTKYNTPPPPPSNGTTLTRGSTPYKSDRHRLRATPDPSEITQLQHALDMHGLWVGPMPVKNFIDYFLGRHRVKAMPKKAIKGLFRDMNFDTEESMYLPFMERVQTTAKLIPGFKMIDTSNHADPNARKKIRPDPTMYRADIDLTKSTTRFEYMELHFEFKRNNSKDPFEDPKADSSAEERLNFDIESDAKDRKRCRGQICSYVIEWMSQQHRLFAFTIYIGHPWARFIRWDRAGAIVSEKFNFVEDARPLNKFLWRFVHVNDARRGLDPTVRHADPDEIELAKTYLTEWQPPENNPRPILVMDVPVVDKKGREDIREFIVWDSMAVPDCIVGRATRGYPALETKTKGHCFLKDTWRAECVEPESNILNRLLEKGVRNVPPYLCGGDLALPMHQTLTDLYAQSVDGSETRAFPWRCGRDLTRVTRRIHHRLVVNFIGKKLTVFKSSKQLLQVTLDAFIAHKDAFEKADVLHRDVSINNILISRDNAHGVLIDWDLAIVLKDKEGTQPRKHERTGTWQFMSTLLLKFPDKTHTIQDDMESFIHVILHTCLRFLPHNKEDKVRNIFTQVFDFHYREEGKDVGGHGKKNMIVDRDHIGRDFSFTNNKHLNAWFNIALKEAKAWIQYKESSLVTLDPEQDASDAPYGMYLERNAPPAPTPAPPPSLFSSHEQFLGMWTAVLKADDPPWPENDRTEDHLKKLNPQFASNPSWKRRREVDDVVAGEYAKKRLNKSCVFSKPVKSSSLVHHLRAR